MNWIGWNNWILLQKMELYWDYLSRNLRLYGRNGFVPTIVNNQIYSQGFFSEIETFANIVEERQENMGEFGLESVRSTYELIKGIEDMIVI